MSSIKQKDIQEFFGLSKTGLSNWKKDQGAKGNIYKALEYYYQNVVLEPTPQILAPVASLTTYRVKGEAKEGRFVYSIEHPICSSLKEFSLVDKETSPELEELIDTAIRSVIVAYRFDRSDLKQIRLRRIDTKKEKEELFRELLFL